MLKLGLAMGSIPFLLREHLSYAQLGVFSLASYPYSLKLFWSPIVDAIFHPSIGRRKSWICPMQFIIGTTMLWISTAAIERMNSVRSMYFKLYPLLRIAFVFSARWSRSRIDCDMDPASVLCRDTRYCRRWLGINITLG